MIYYEDSNMAGNQMHLTQKGFDTIYRD
jgi:hypothetical protein